MAGMDAAFWRHVLERAMIHFFSAAGVYHVALWGFWALERRVRWWPELRGWWELILPAVLSFGFISFREIFDVAAGGSPVKSICDWLSWIGGLGCAAWSTYRLHERLEGVVGEIRAAASRPRRTGARSGPERPRKRDRKGRRG